LNKEIEGQMSLSQARGQEGAPRRLRVRRVRQRRVRLVAPVSGAVGILEEEGRRGSSSSWESAGEAEARKHPGLREPPAGTCCGASQEGQDCDMRRIPVCCAG